MIFIRVESDDVSGCSYLENSFICLSRTEPRYAENTSSLLEVIIRSDDDRSMIRVLP